MVKKKNMRNRIQNISAYFECLFKNKFTRLSIIYLGLGAFSILEGKVFIAISTLVFFLFLFLLPKCGMNSYTAYKRGLKHMITYQSPLENETYCTTIGYKVALRRFKKNYPKEYQAMMEKPPKETGVIKSHS